MMFWRTVCIVASIPYVIQSLLFLSAGQNIGLAWSFSPITIPLLPLLYYLFQLVNETNGYFLAVFHALLTAILAPFFLIGPLLIPLLVRGDARRLLIVQKTENVG